MEHNIVRILSVGLLCMAIFGSTAVMSVSAGCIDCNYVKGPLGIIHIAPGSGYKGPAIESTTEKEMAASKTRSEIYEKWKLQYPEITLEDAFFREEASKVNAGFKWMTETFGGLKSSSGGGGKLFMGQLRAGMKQN